MQTILIAFEVVMVKMILQNSSFMVHCMKLAEENQPKLIIIFGAVLEKF